MEKTFQIAPEKCQYFKDLDASIVQWSITVGRISMELNAANQTLSTLYHSRANNLNEQLQLAGIDVTKLRGAKIDPHTGNVVVDLVDVPENGAGTPEAPPPPPNGS